MFIMNSPSWAWGSHPIPQNPYPPAIPLNNVWMRTTLKWWAWELPEIIIIIVCQSLLSFLLFCLSAYYEAGWCDVLGAVTMKDSMSWNTSGYSAKLKGEQSYFFPFSSFSSEFRKTQWTICYLLCCGILTMPSFLSALRDVRIKKIKLKLSNLSLL